MFANTRHGDIERHCSFLTSTRPWQLCLSSMKTNGIRKKWQEHFCSHPGWSVKIYHSEVSKSTHQPPSSEASNSFWFVSEHAFLVLSNLNTGRGSIIWMPPFLINSMRGSLALKMTVKHSALRSFACFVIEWLKKSIFYLICYGTEQSDLNWNDPDLPRFVIHLIIIPLGLYLVRIV